MKWKVILLAFIIVIVIWFTLVAPGKIQRIEDFRGIKVGDVCPAFHWAKSDMREKGIYSPGRFFIFLINGKVEVEAELDDRRFYNDITDMIVKKGGHFWASGDGKVARVFRIKPVLSRNRSVFALARDAIERVLWDRGLIKNRSNQWEYDASLIVVTDGGGKIFALYKNAKLEDVKRVVRELRL